MWVNEKMCLLSDVNDAKLMLTTKANIQPSDRKYKKGKLYNSWYIKAMCLKNDWIKTITIQYFSKSNL